jgi:two-component system, NtrC family, sensor kinase
MMSDRPETNCRILVVEDNRAIHDDFRKILIPDRGSAALDAAEADLFGDGPATDTTEFVIDSAYQGEEGYELARKAVAAGKPYAMAFVDMRMPPGWDGAQTIEKLWEVDPNLQVVLCTAYSDYSWEELSRRLTRRDSLLILKKPFDNVEVLQLAHALTRKWVLARKGEWAVSDLQIAVSERTKELATALDGLAKEMATRDRLETELRLAAKLQAVGQLAAGIAHEINTPMQFIGDNASFLRDAFDELVPIVQRFALITEILSGLPSHLGQAKEARALYEGADTPYLIENIPRALASTLEGVQRVSEIVRAMKELGVPQQREAQPADLNRAIHNALLVSRNEYKLVADIETDLGSLPPVTCDVGELGQVFLNLIVNAAHAITGVVAGTASRGRIDVRTRVEGDHAIIEIGDSGGGIPREIQERVYDPFFTTKAVGKGTGQGLAIARSIVDKHGGTISFDSRPGVGTVFRITLPLDGKALVATRRGGIASNLPHASPQ